MKLINKTYYLIGNPETGQRYEVVKKSINWRNVSILAGGIAFMIYVICEWYVF